MQASDIVQKTVDFVKETLKNAESGHDWQHILRVWNNARKIATTESVDLLVVELGALLHDIADAKFHNGDEKIGPLTARRFLESLSVPPETVWHVENIVRYISFKGGLGDQKFSSPELSVVQDADRLDALGAIGIARTFHYGGYKNREMYNPDIPPQVYASREAYMNSTSPTINHFYEKLLLLKDRMNTETGRIMAEKRHIFLEIYLEQFFEEWNGQR